MSSPTRPPDAAVELGSDLVTYAARLIRAVRRTAELPAGFRVVSLLDEHGPSGITRLAALDRCSQPTMSGAVRELVSKGLVDKAPNPEDARSTVVTLTDRGRAELTRVRRLNGEIVANRLADHAGATDDLAAAVALLRDLLDVGFEVGFEVGSEVGAETDSETGTETATGSRAARTPTVPSTQEGSS